MITIPFPVSFSTRPAHLSTLHALFATLFTLSFLLSEFAIRYKFNGAQVSDWVKIIKLSERQRQKTVRTTAYLQSYFKFGHNFINRQFEQNPKTTIKNQPNNEHTLK